MSYTEKMYKAIYKSDKEIFDKIFYTKADRSINAPYFPFIYERMFSTILAKHQDEFNILSYTKGN